MPRPFWPSDPVLTIVAFEARHQAPEAGALLLSSLHSVEALHYLADWDAIYESSGVVPGGYPADIVDVAHVRWATGTCVTSLDLNAAALARAFGSDFGRKEVDLGDFRALNPSKAAVAAMRAMPTPAMTWIQTVLSDLAYLEMKDARDALTHRRLPRHLYARVGSDGPTSRLDLQVGRQRIPTRQLIERARDLATGHTLSLLSLLLLL